ncbi:mRNA-decapping enzyme subunit 2 [Phtheirospermum japonicum]|uniref:mRNA-decapping enzyme subunit 2 n=1 Tax=Phtheirospermum japonicum TaxID=374723 RepID=A0A830CZ48_9LAMI|nr:mRNA-decapping enzyme subunit 2 [Phtheirospermum japonicum]
MQIYTAAVVTCFAVVGLFACREWGTLRGKMGSFAAGSVSYVMTLVWTAVAYPLCLQSEIMPAVEDETPPVALNYIPEVVLKKRKANDSWAIERKLQLQERLKRRKPNSSFIKKPEQFIREYRDKMDEDGADADYKILGSVHEDLSSQLNRSSSTPSKNILPPQELLDDLCRYFRSCLLVKGWKGTSWSFPRGKKSKDEEDHKCAIREKLDTKYLLPEWQDLLRRLRNFKDLVYHDRWLQVTLSCSSSLVRLPCVFRPSRNPSSFFF